MLRPLTATLATAALAGSLLAAAAPAAATTPTIPILPVTEHVGPGQAHADFGDGPVNMPSVTVPSAQSPYLRGAERRRTLNPRPAEVPSPALITWVGLERGQLAIAHLVTYRLLHAGARDLTIYVGIEDAPAWAEAHTQGAGGLAMPGTDEIWVRGAESWDPERWVDVAIHEALHHHLWRLAGSGGAPAGWQAIDRVAAELTGITDGEATHALLGCAQTALTPGSSDSPGSQCSTAWAPFQGSIRQLDGSHGPPASALDALYPRGGSVSGTHDLGHRRFLSPA